MVGLFIHTFIHTMSFKIHREPESANIQTHNLLLKELVQQVRKYNTLHRAQSLRSQQPHT